MVFQCDPCGILCLVFTYLIVFYADYVVVFQLIRPVLKDSMSAIINTMAFNTVVFLLGFSHLCAVFGDPGWIPLGLYPLERNEVGTVCGFSLLFQSLIWYEFVSLKNTFGRGTRHHACSLVPVSIPFLVLQLRFLLLISTFVVAFSFGIFYFTIGWAAARATVPFGHDDDDESFIVVRTYPPTYVR
ncbi:hypothetical protein EG68_11027 [Paragonimus skrjabini miyazakii]|uniref:Uncharacterized protein n=1 Tax=Paragonimus skrjabini miyazakii TaxID=59628 RepID=A0A8S9YJE6_9TREM|nr:hypothetical protein EG68_11027 [Paragonimus skrjabini miyazakii]